MTTTAADTTNNGLPPDRAGWWSRHSELVVVVGVLAMATFLTVETIRMDVPPGVGTPGPQFFPAIIAGFLYLQAVLLTIEILRHPGHSTSAQGGAEVSEDMLEDMGGIDDTSELAVVQATRAGAEPEPTMNVRTVSITFGALVAFVLVLNPIGWLLAATLLFWTICRAFGSTRPLFDLAVAALVASVIQLAFSAGLGLTLPAGIFEGILQ